MLHHDLILFHATVLNIMGTVPSSPLYDKYMALPLNDMRVLLLDFLTPAERRMLTTVSSTLHAFIGCFGQVLMQLVCFEV